MSKKDEFAAHELILILIHDKVIDLKKLFYFNDFQDVKFF